MDIANNKSGKGTDIPRYILIISVYIFYTLLSIFFFGYPVLTHITKYYMGGGIDPTQYIWSFEWVKYCALHLKNPLNTPFIWAPRNFNLTGSTAVLGIAFLLPSFNYGGRYTNPNVLSFFKNGNQNYSHNYNYKKFIEEGKKIELKDGFRALYCIIKYNVFKK